MSRSWNQTVTRDIESNHMMKFQTFVSSETDQLMEDGHLASNAPYREREV